MGLEICQGNGHVGRVVMFAAAKHLTPVTLKFLGGQEWPPWKCPMKPVAYQGLVERAQSLLMKLPRPRTADCV